MTLAKMYDDLSKEQFICPECERVVRTSPAKGVPNQALRRCNVCDTPFYVNLDSTPVSLFPGHYIAGSGERGCLYDSCHVYRTLKDAVEGLAETFGLGRTRKAQLKRNRSLELKPDRDGAEYCEITACSCATPWVHDEDADENDWQQ